jgi:hypothetical protein
MKPDFGWVDGGDTKTRRPLNGVRGASNQYGARFTTHKTLADSPTPWEVLAAPVTATRERHEARYSERETNLGALKEPKIEPGTLECQRSTIS